MTRIELFNSTVTNDSASALRDALKSVATAFNLSVTSADKTLFNLDSGELLANVGRLTTKCQGVSVWATSHDYGVRVTKDYINKLSRTQQFMLENCFAHKGKKEYRYSFSDVQSVLYFFSTLIAYASADIKKAEKAESVIA